MRRLPHAPRPDAGALATLLALVLLVFAPGLALADQCGFADWVNAPAPGGATSWQPIPGVPMEFRVTRSSMSKYSTYEESSFKVEVRNLLGFRAYIGETPPQLQDPGKRDTWTGLRIPPGETRNDGRLIKGYPSRVFVMLLKPRADDFDGRLLCGSGGGGGGGTTGGDPKDPPHKDPCKSDLNPNRTVAGEPAGPSLCANPMQTSQAPDVRTPTRMDKQADVPQIRAPIIQLPTPKQRQSSSQGSGSSQRSSGSTSSASGSSRPTGDGYYRPGAPVKKGAPASAAMQPNLADVAACRGFTTSNFQDRRWDGKGDVQVWGLCSQSFGSYKMYLETLASGDVDGANQLYDMHAKLARTLSAYLSGKPIDPGSVQADVSMRATENSSEPAQESTSPEPKGGLAGLLGRAKKTQEKVEQAQAKKEEVTQKVNAARGIFGALSALKNGGAGAQAALDEAAQSAKMSAGDGAAPAAAGTGSAGPGDLPEGTYTNLSGSLTVTLSYDASGLLIVQDPWKTTPYRHKSGSTWEATSPSKYGTVFQVYKSGADRFIALTNKQTPQQLAGDRNNVFRMTSAAPTKSQAAVTHYRDNVFAEYRDRIEKDPANTHLWAACGAAAVAKSIMNDGWASEYAAKAAASIKPIMTNPTGKSPCPDAITDAEWSAR